MSNVTAMDPTVDLWWVPECDKELPEDQQLRLKYRNLPAKKEALITDEQIQSSTKGKTSKYQYRVSMADLKRCEIMIVGWENFNYGSNHPTKKGQPVPFSVDNIGMLPTKIRSEFVTFVTGRDEPEEEEDSIDLGEAEKV